MGSPNAGSTPVIVISGFLGSGKTTLLNAVLKNPAFADSAVVVNEFGEIAVDHLLMSGSRDNIVVTEAGCLCCAALDSLPETLADLFGRRARGETPAFSRLFIETSGLADPGPILRTLMRHPVVSHFCHIQGLVCVVDAVNGPATLAHEPEAIAQAALADRIVISKMDLAADSATPALLVQIKTLNPTAEVRFAAEGAAEVLSALQSGLPWLGATAAQEHGEDGHVHQTDERHDDAVTSESFWLSRPSNWQGVADWTAWARDRYGAALLRCKGVLKVDGVAGGVVLHGVQGIFDTHRLPEWPDDDRRSRLVVIGRGLQRRELDASLPLLMAS